MFLPVYNFRFTSRDHKPCQEVREKRNSKRILEHGRIERGGTIAPSPIQNVGRVERVLHVQSKQNTPAKRCALIAVQQLAESLSGSIHKRSIGTLEELAVS